MGYVGRRSLTIFSLNPFSLYFLNLIEEGRGNG